MDEVLHVALLQIQLTHGLHAEHVAGCGNGHDVGGVVEHLVRDGTVVLPLLVLGPRQRDQVLQSTKHSHHSPPINITIQLLQ